MFGQGMQNSQSVSDSLYPNTQTELKMEYTADFSEKFEKAKNKLMYASVFSITVGLYIVDKETNFLGVKFENITDRRMEWAAWSAALIFFINAILRYLDERRSYENYRNKVKQFINEVNALVSQLNSVSEDLFYTLAKNGPLIGDFAKFKRQSEGILQNVGVVFQEENLSIEVKKIRQSLNQIEDEMKRINRVNDHTAEKIYELPDRIQNFQKTISTMKKFRNISGFRFIVIDLLLPVSLFLFATFIHIFPNSKANILELVSNQHLSLITVDT